MSLFEGFNRRYQAELAEEISVIDASLLAGNIVDFTEYKRMTGRRAGLLYALERHKELLTLMEEANDK
jgi:hypothetical protein